MKEPKVLEEKFWFWIIYIFSIIIVLAVAFLILGPRPEGMREMLDVSVLPHINALLNSTSTLLLLLALWFIKRKEIQKHKVTMLCTFSTSSLFLVTYLIYHWFKAGPKLYLGEYTLLYYFILLTHIILAIGIIPLALITLYRGWNMQVVKHRRIARITYPIWLYVSVTGVVIYLMLY